MSSKGKKKKLYKVDNGIIFGVCGGIAEYFNIDPTIVRVIWAILAFFYGSGILIYIICALVMPSKSQVENKEKEDSYINTDSKEKKD